MEIIYGTSNMNKLNQVRRYMENSSFSVNILSLKDIGFSEEIEEIGTTFEENSLIKALAIKKYCNENGIDKLILTDDTGLCIDYLNGEPGVYSHRYAGQDASQEEIINLILSKLKGVEYEKRTATFVCVLTLLLKNGERYVARGEAKGHIALNNGSMGGLMYSPIFIHEGHDKVANDMPQILPEKTHRGKAFLDVINYIKSNYKD